MRLDSFEPDSNANQDIDGLMFPDMPWMISGELPRPSTTPSHRPGERRPQAQPALCLWLRCLLAGGGDAAQPGAPELEVQGLTGHLSLRRRSAGAPGAEVGRLAQRAGARLPAPAGN